MKRVELLFEDRLPNAAVTPGGGSLVRGILLVLLIFAGTRLLTWTATYYGASVLFRIQNRLEPPFDKHQRRWQEKPLSADDAEYRSMMDLLTDFAPLCRFDGEHYRSIFEDGGGYRYQKPVYPVAEHRELEQNVAFFPLFPLVCRCLTGWLTPRPAMVLVVHVCALAGVILLYLWIRRRVDERVALFTVTVTLCFPSAAYYSYAYAESITLLLMVVALWLTDSRAFVPAAVVCGVTTAARPTALGIVGVLALAYWFNSTEPRRGRRALKLVPLVLVGVTGIAAYAGYLTYHFGSPFIYVDNFKAGWVPDQQRADWLPFLTLAPFWEQFKYFRNLVLFAPPIGLINAPNTLMWNAPLDLFVLFLSIAGMWRVPRSFRPLLALGPLIFLQSYAASGGAKFGLEPIARYMAVSVPAFVVLAAWCLREWRPLFRHLLLGFMLLLQAAWAFRFGLQEWVG